VVAFQLGLSFFGFSENNLYKLYNTTFYLVKWGFSHDDIHRLPIPEYEYYVKFLNEFYAEKNKAANPEKGPPTIGNTIGTLQDV